MWFKSINKKTKISITIILFIFLVIGITYAFWVVYKKQNSENLLMSGCFDITFDSGENVELENVFPVSDTIGLSYVPHKISVTNNCSLYAKYYINLEIMNTTTLNSEYVKISLDKEDIKLLSDFNETTPVNSTASKSYILKESTLAIGQTVTYDLYKWLDENAPMDTMGATFNSKITVVAEPIDMNEFLSRDILSDAHSSYISAYPNAGEHPRLLIKSNEIETVKANLTHPQNASALAGFQTSLKYDVTTSPTVLDSFYLVALQARALNYILYDDTESGLEAVAKIKDYLRSYFDEEKNGYTTSKDVAQIMFTMSLIYDWCYDLISLQEKAELVKLTEDLAIDYFEFGYPQDVSHGTVVGHNSEERTQRALPAFGIAAYDEFPDIYNFFVGKIFRWYLESRNYLYDAGLNFQGNSYGMGRGQADLYLDMILYKMTGNKYINENMSGMTYQFLYSRIDNDSLLPNGDMYEGYKHGYKSTYYLTSMLYDNDAAKVAKSELLRWNGLNQGINVHRGSYDYPYLNEVTFLILNKPNQETKEYNTLPLSIYYPSPYGGIVTRTGWDYSATSDDVVVEMKIVEQSTGNHQHNDSGSFQIYYKGLLTSKSGAYSIYHDNHHYNYGKQTISSNSLLIYDENGKLNYQSPTLYNSGSQKSVTEPAYLSDLKTTQFNFGKVINYSINEGHYSYISGDITEAYNFPPNWNISNRAEAVYRSMAFFPNIDSNKKGTFVVYDKVDSLNASYKKTWLLQAQKEPTVSGNRITLNSKYNGFLEVDSLLPASSTINKIRGFQINGNDFSFDGYNPDTAYNDYLPSGWGRIEISPVSENETDYFLNVLEISRNGGVSKANLVENAQYYGAVTSDYVILFAKDVTKPMTDQISINVTGMTGKKVFIAGIKEGIWNDGNNNYTATDDEVMFFMAQNDVINLSYGNL